MRMPVAGGRILPSFPAYRQASGRSNISVRLCLQLDGTREQILNRIRFFHRHYCLCFLHAILTMKDSNDQLTVVSASESPVGSSSSRDGESPVEKKSLRRRIRAVVWDSFDRSPEERRFIAKIDFFILTWAGFTYFSKNLNTNNIC